jgi:hypothetical protein
VWDIHLAIAPPDRIVELLLRDVKERKFETYWREGCVFTYLTKKLCDGVSV